MLMYDPECMKLHKEVEDVQNDLMTQHYYVGAEATEITIKNHIKRCPKCKAYNESHIDMSRTP